MQLRLVAHRYIFVLKAESVRRPPRHLYSQSRIGSTPTAMTLRLQHVPTFGADGRRWFDLARVLANTGLSIAPQAATHGVAKHHAMVEVHTYGKISLPFG